MKNKQKHFWWRIAVSTVLLLLLAFVIMKNRSQFVGSIDVIASMNHWYILVMAGLFCVTTGFAALTYLNLSFRRGNFHDYYLIEFAAAGLNRLLPSGIGSIGLHGVFLHRRKHTVPQAVAIVSTNNALGMVTHLSLLAIIALIHPVSLQSYDISVPDWVYLVVMSLLIILALFLLIPATQSYVAKFLRNFTKSLGLYADKPGKVLAAAVFSLLITITNVTIFALAINSVGMNVGYIDVFLIYTAGVLFGGITPTPGGLGGVEAGLMAGLVAKGMPATQALAAALVFRIATFWFPMVVGSLAFFVARLRKMI